MPTFSWHYYNESVWLSHTQPTVGKKSSQSADNGNISYVWWRLHIHIRSKLTQTFMNASSKFGTPVDDRQIELRSFKRKSHLFKLTSGWFAIGELNFMKWNTHDNFQSRYGLKSFSALWLHNMGAWSISWHYDSGAKLTRYALKCYFAVKFIRCFEHEYETIYAMSNCLWLAKRQNIWLLLY